jgi:hypothetical protein
VENELTPQDKERIEASIREKYLKAAASPEGLFRYPTGRAGLEALAAVRLEGEAYQRGYYKAFALTALAPGGGAACAPSGPSPAPGAT